MRELRDFYEESFASLVEQRLASSPSYGEGRAFAYRVSVCSQATRGSYEATSVSVDAETGAVSEPQQSSAIA